MAASRKFLGIPAKNRSRQAGTEAGRRRRRPARRGPARGPRQHDDWAGLGGRGAAGRLQRRQSARPQQSKLWSTTAVKILPKLSDCQNFAKCNLDLICQKRQNAVLPLLQLPKIAFVRCHMLRPYLQLVYIRTMIRTRKNRLLVPAAGTYFSR